MILSTLDKSRKGGAYEQIPSLVLGQRWTPQLNSRNMMKVVLCVWIEPERTGIYETGLLAGS